MAEQPVRPWTNSEIADIFDRIGDLVEISEKEGPFQVRAYHRAADNIRHLDGDIVRIWQEGALEEIPGVGKAIAKKIDELMRTGRLHFLEELEKEVPPGVLDMLQIPGVGPKKARLFWKSLGITSIEELKKAAEAGKLRTLPGMGAKSEAKILEGIAILQSLPDRIPLGEARPLAERMIEQLRELDEEVVEKISLAGSARRWRETVGDLDILVASTMPGPVMDKFSSLPEVAEVMLKGETKTSVRLHNGLQVDLRVLEPKRWGTGLQYFTGSKAHNIALRNLALDQGWSLSEYALKRVDTGQEKLCPTEEEVYETLGLPWIPPELREDRGEIKAAMEGKLPRLLKLSDLRGDLHSHTTWSDGSHTIEQMAEAARSRGFSYLAITDHSTGLGVVSGVGESELEEQRRIVDELNSRWSDFRLLLGVEVEVMADGSLALSDEVLSRLDVVIAAVHSGLNQDRDTLTGRAISALRNPHVDILAHPTGRLLGKRKGGDFDMEAIFREAAKLGKVIEVNSSPWRLDLNDVLVRRAVELGVKISIDSDAHKPSGFDDLIYGVKTARRGWVEPENVINTWPLDRVIAWLERRG